MWHENNWIQPEFFFLGNFFVLFPFFFVFTQWIRFKNLFFFFGPHQLFWRFLTLTVFDSFVGIQRRSISIPFLALFIRTLWYNKWLLWTCDQFHLLSFDFFSLPFLADQSDFFENFAQNDWFFYRNISFNRLFFEAPPSHFQFVAQMHQASHHNFGWLITLKSSINPSLEIHSLRCLAHLSAFLGILNVCSSFCSFIPFSFCKTIIYITTKLRA